MLQADKVIAKNLTSYIIIINIMMIRKVVAQLSKPVFSQERETNVQHNKESWIT